MIRNGEPGQSYRISIPNIPAGAVPWYLTVFTTITIYLTVTNTLFAMIKGNAVGWQAIQYITTGEMLKAGGVALIASPIITEVSRVVIGAMWTKRKVEEALRSNQARWEAWNRRRQEAEAKGIVFDEPPPKLENQPESPH